MVFLRIEGVLWLRLTAKAILQDLTCTMKLERGQTF